MVCPDLIKEHIFHDSWPNIGAYRHDVEKTFGDCLQNQCPCYVLCDGKEYCTKHSKELMQ